MSRVKKDENGVWYCTGCGKTFPKRAAAAGHQPHCTGLTQLGSSSSGNSTNVCAHYARALQQPEQQEQLQEPAPGAAQQEVDPKEIRAFLNERFRQFDARLGSLEKQVTNEVPHYTGAKKPAWERAKPYLLVGGLCFCGGALLCYALSDNQCKGGGQQGKSLLGGVPELAAKEATKAGVRKLLK